MSLFRHLYRAFDKSLVPRNTCHMNEEESPGQIFYGTTQHGHRIHFGTEVLYPDPGNNTEWVVVSRCGNRMYSHDPERPAPARVTEFCRTCFRAIAWEVYETRMKELASYATEA